jgi:hypothetical protein
LSALNRLAANSNARSARRQKPLRAALQRAEELTTPELLDLLEETLAKRRQPGSAKVAAPQIPGLFSSDDGNEPAEAGDVHWEIPDGEDHAGRKAGLRERMAAAALSPDLFSRLFGVSVWAVSEWLESKSEPPEWVWPAIRFHELLSVAERQKLLAARQDTGRNKVHPFSRIEDL